MQPSVAIVILNYNGKKFLEQFLPSVIACTYSNLRIVVADNASTDDSVAFVQTTFPSVEILVKESNAGYAGGYNWALKLIDTDYYALVNSDVELTPNWLQPLVIAMEKDKTFAAAQPKLLAYNDKDSFEYAGASGGWIDALGFPFSRGRVFETCEKDEHQYDDVAEIFWATGAAMFVRSNVFHELQGFDETFFAHMEEVDLCWRMQLAGYKIIAVPSSVAYHVGGGTLQAGYQKTYLNFRNNHLMMYKNLPLAEVIWKLPLRFVIDLVAAFKALASGDKIFFKAVMKSHFVLARSWFTKKTTHQLPKKSLSKLAGVYNGSIVWQYFVNKKNKFSEIVTKSR